MKLTILGSGTAVPSIKRSAPAYLLEVSNKIILLDSGEGTKRRLAEAGKNLSDIDYIFYTHTHVDHVSELPAIIWGANWHEQPRKQDLPVYGPKGFEEFFDKLMAVMWPQHEKHSKFKTRITELDGIRFKVDNFIVRTKFLDKQKLTYVEDSIGYRVEYEGKSFVYTGDVGYNENVIKLAKGTDLLLIEAAVPVPFKSHLTPIQAGELTEKAEVKKLVLTHFYPEVERINIIDEAKKTFNGKIILAEDLMEIDI